MATSSSLSSLSRLHIQLSPKLPTCAKAFKGRHSLSAATASQNPHIPQPPPPPPSTAASCTLPLREIPGDYGHPIIGPWRDRQDYFYNQGRENFFKSRMNKYQSTIFRTNMPPGPFISSNPNVVVLLDGKSFPVLFDTDKVEKKNLFTGTYMPSTALTGGYRTLSYLDPSEPNHSKLKNLMFFLLSHRRDRVVPEFQNIYGEMFDALEKELAAKGKAGFNAANDQAAFSFLARSLYGTDPRETGLGSDGPKLIGTWILFQLHPVLPLGLPRLIEEFLHTFSLPPIFVRKDYRKLYEFFHRISSAALDHAENVIGIPRDEACHNLLFATCFNSFGGMKILFPNMVRLIGQGGPELHSKLAREIRSAIETSGGDVTIAAMERMPLMKSAVYEALRIDPPVPSQFGRAKRDFVIESHEAAFEVREGEVLFGFQPFATKDPKIFDRAEEFVPERFVGGEGERLLKHVVWSNGPESESAAVDNKQCAGKDFVVLAARLLVVEIFRRYDSFGVEVAASPLGAAVNLASLERASL